MSGHFEREARAMWLLPATVILAAIVAGVLGVPYFMAREAAVESAMRALIADACEQGSEFRRARGRCPRDLQELSSSFPDGSSADDLERLSYTSDGSSCSASWSSPHEAELSCEFRLASPVDPISVPKLAGAAMVALGAVLVVRY